ncbi:MAG: ComEC/Rec2 family competence protein [Clostridia bacterium]|nr:ComEC/Rec2 family competence protein [Clostridia bacterium]
MFDDKDPNRIINYRPLFIAAAGIIAGTAAYQALFDLRISAAARIIVLAVFGLLVGALCVYSAVRRRKTAFIFAAAFVLAFARMAAAVPDNVVAAEYNVTGVVSEVSETQIGTVTLTDVRLDGKHLRYKMRLKAEGETFSVGDEIEAVCLVSEPNRSFGSYDERMDLLSKGISAKAECRSASVVSTDRLPVRQRLLSVKRLIHSRIFELFPENAPVVAGFLLGERSGVDEADYESFRLTGTAHLLALSGFHVGIITALLFLMLPKRFPWLRFIVIGLFLIGYCALTAFSASLVRASIMCMCLLLADAAEQRRDAVSALSLAAIVILAVSPYMLWSAGFRLSFAATFGILLVTSGGAFSKNRPVNRIFSALAVTFGATVATALISARYFGIFTTYGLIANAFAAPVFSAAVTLSFVSVLVGIPFPAVGRVMAFVPDRMIGFAMLGLQRIQSLPYACLNVVSPSALSGILVLVMMFCISPYVLRPLKKRLALTSLVFLLFTASVAADIIRS